MSGKLEKTLGNTFGCPTEGNTTQIDFSGTSASGVLDANEMYRVAASEDCYISFITDENPAQATSAGVLMFGGVPEVFTTTSKETLISVIRKSTNGELVVTKLKSRG
jgi:hypothetical protein